MATRKKSATAGKKVGDVSVKKSARGTHCVLKVVDAKQLPKSMRAKMDKGVQMYGCFGSKAAADERATALRNGTYRPASKRKAPARKR